MASDLARCDSSSSPTRRLTNLKEDQVVPVQRAPVVARTFTQATVVAVTNPSKTPQRRSNKLTYEVSSVAPLPADLVETISAAHAKVFLSTSVSHEKVEGSSANNPDPAE